MSCHRSSSMPMACGLLASAQEQAPPSSEGTDRSGTIRMRLDADGQPASFRVEPGWHRKLAAPAFGDAVVEAFHAAMGVRLAVWTKTLQERGWQAEVDRLQVDSVDKQPPASPAAQLPPAFRPAAQATRPRSIDEITEDVRRSTMSRTLSQHRPRRSEVQVRTGRASSPSLCRRPAWCPATRIRSGRPGRPRPA